MKKRRQLKQKRKTSAGKNNYAVIFAAIVLVIVIVISAKNYLGFKSSHAYTPTPTAVTAFLKKYDYPSMALKPSKVVSSTLSTKAEPTLPVGPANPSGPSDITTPYAFISANQIPGGNFVSYGPVYYSPGRVLPSVIFSGNGMSAVPSGPYVFFVRVDSIMSDGFPSRTTPVKLEISTGVITELAASRDYPAAWNYLVPANVGKDFIMGWTNIAERAGQIYIYKNGVQVWASDLGSYLMPTISTDGTKAAWAYNSGGAYGRDIYVFDIASRTATKIYDASPSDEAQAPSISVRGEVVAFAVVIDIPNNGIRDQKIYTKGANGAGGPINMTDLPTYRWNIEPKIYSMTSVYGYGVVWSSNQDPWVYRGYTILGTQLDQIFRGYAQQLVSWQANYQKMWPAVAPEGGIIFSHELTRNIRYAIYGTFKRHIVFEILNPGGRCMGANFEN